MIRAHDLHDHSRGLSTKPLSIVNVVGIGLNARLHLVRPLGFDLDDARVKRAGLDYW